MVAAATAVVAVLESTPVGLSDASPVYFVAVVILGSLLGTWPAIATALASFVVYDLLFTQPTFTIVVSDPRELLDLVLFLVLAVIVGRLSALGRERADEASRRAAESTALFAISRILATEPDVEAAAPLVAARLVADGSLERVWIVRNDGGGQPTIVADTGEGRPLPASSFVTSLVRMPGDTPAKWVVAHEPAAARPVGRRRHRADRAERRRPGVPIVRVRMEADGRRRRRDEGDARRRPPRARPGDDPPPVARSRPARARDPPRRPPPRGDRGGDRPSRRRPEERAARRGLARPADAAGEHPRGRRLARRPGRRDRRGHGPGDGRRDRRRGGTSRPSRPGGARPEPRSRRARSGWTSSRSSSPTPSAPSSTACGRCSATGRSGSRSPTSCRPSAPTPSSSTASWRTSWRTSPATLRPRRPWRSPRRRTDGRVRLTVDDGGPGVSDDGPRPAVREVPAASVDEPGVATGARAGPGDRPRHDRGDGRLGDARRRVRSAASGSSSSCRPPRRSPARRTPARRRRRRRRRRPAMSGSRGAVAATAGARLLLVEDDDATRGAGRRQPRRPRLPDRRGDRRGCGAASLGRRAAGRDPAGPRAAGRRRDHDHPAGPARGDDADPRPLGPRTPSRTRSPRSRRAPTTTSRSRSGSPSCGPASRRSCVARRAPPRTRPGPSGIGPIRIDVARRIATVDGVAAGPHAARVRAAPDDALRSPAGC